MEINFFGPASSELEDILDWTLLWAGVVFLVLGVIGIIIILSGYKIISDQVLQFALGFVSLYMLFFGLFLMAYHGKIVVKPKPQG
jgi:ABC-type transport system involved in multi-copper enzyme maturation permease subunit